MLCSNLITELPEAHELNAFELLSDSRAKMTARQLTHMDSKEKRVAALFFLEIGASSMQFNFFRRAMDSVSTHPRSWDKSLTMMTQCGLQKQQSRANKYIDVTQLHLTRLPDEDGVVEHTEEDDAGSDEE